MSRSGQTPNTIPYIGADTGSERDQWLATGATRVILVEPNPERARELATRAATDDRIEVVQKAVAAESGQLCLKRFNLPALSSLREPTGLLELFPGLRTEREIDVDTITPTELLETVPLEEGSRHWLIIDAPGEEEGIVNALGATDQLAHFNRLILHCGIDPLYSDNAPAATLLDQLQEARYEIEQKDDSDPDRPCWSLQRNPLRLENQTLRQQVAELEQQVKELEKSRDEFKDVVSDRDARNAQLERDLADIKGAMIDCRMN